MKSRIKVITENLKLLGVGLEIGPLHKPIIRKGKYNIFYLDHLDTQGLKEKYQAHHNVNIEKIVDVDFVLKSGSVSQSIPSSQLFDYVIASHVIEHVPDFIRYLIDIEKILKPKGVLSLAIPDKRYCFDMIKNNSTLGEILHSFHTKQVKPDFLQVFNHFSNVVRVTAPEAWSNPRDPKPARSLKEAYRIACESQKPDNYRDVHCWAFTPESFTQIVNDLYELELVPFKVSNLTETRPNTNEFYAQLIKY